MNQGYGKELAFEALAAVVAKVLAPRRYSTGWAAEFDAALAAELCSRSVMCSAVWACFEWIDGSWSVGIEVVGVEIVALLRNT
jgi:hypothetical protein